MYVQHYVTEQIYKIYLFFEETFFYFNISMHILDSMKGNVEAPFGFISAQQKNTKVRGELIRRCRCYKNTEEGEQYYRKIKGIKSVSEIRIRLQI